MRNPLVGVRGRVTFTVLAVTAALYSLLGTIGFVAIADSGRTAIRERIGEVLDQLETAVLSGSGTVTLSTPDGVDAVLVSPDGVPPVSPNGAVILFAPKAYVISAITATCPTSLNRQAPRSN